MLRKQHKSSAVSSSCDLEKQLEAKVAKVRSLEEAYRKQEKVIEKMEMLLRMQSISKGDDDDDDGDDDDDDDDDDYDVPWLLQRRGQKEEWKN